MGLWWRGEEWTPDGDGEYWKKGSGGILSSMAPNRNNNSKKNSTRLQSLWAWKSPVSQESKETDEEQTAQQVSKQMNVVEAYMESSEIQKRQKGAKNQEISMGMGGIIYAKN